MARKTIYAHPYADVYGKIDVPDGLTEDQEREYIDNHFDDIKFGEAELDYAGTDYEIYDE